MKLLSDNEKNQLINDFINSKKSVASIFGFNNISERVKNIKDIFSFTYFIAIKLEDLTDELNEPQYKNTNLLINGLNYTFPERIKLYKEKINIMHDLKIKNSINIIFISHIDNKIDDQKNDFIIPSWSAINYNNNIKIHIKKNINGKYQVYQEKNVQ